jgi:hypothetical protein
MLDDPFPLNLHDLGISRPQFEIHESFGRSNALIIYIRFHFS